MGTTDGAPISVGVGEPGTPTGGGQVEVLGKTVDSQTRCIHYHGPTDVIAIKFKCCGAYYPCFECHRECTDHQAEQWPPGEWREKAVLCGVCTTELTIQTYLDVSSCPECGAGFNEGCRLHRHLYFQTTG